MVILKAVWYYKKLDESSTSNILYIFNIKYYRLDGRKIGNSAKLKMWRCSYV
jgi:hypothetical protein